MVVALTTETITGASGEAETVVVAREEISNSTGTTIVDLEVSIAIDYTDYYKRIATAIETIATNSTAVAADIKRLRDLADHPNGPGIRTITPYGYLGNAILYLLYIKQAQILEDEEAGGNLQTEALAKFNQVIEEMFANFDPNRGGFGE